PARAWELLVGGMLAVQKLRHPKNWAPWAQELAGLAGFGLILWCCFQYDQKTAFPSWNALVPCLGTALIIFSGDFGAKTFAVKILSQRLLVFIGLISFSLYLWHLPVLVLSRSPYWLYWGLDPNRVTIQLAISGALAILTWKYVESPFRNLKVRGQLSTILAGVLCLLSVFGLGNLGHWISTGRAPLSQRAPAFLENLLPSQEEAPYRKWEFRGTPEQILKEGGMLVGEHEASPSFIVLGDSFASMWGPALDQTAKAHRVSGHLLARSLCATLDGLNRSNDETCHPAIEASLQFAELSAIKTVILAIAWSSVTKEHSARYYLKDDLAPQNMRQIALEKTLSRLSRAQKQIFVVLETPGGKDSPYSDAIRSLRSQQKVSYSDQGDSDSLENNFRKEFLRELAGLQEKYLFTVLDPVSVLCSPQGCVVAKSGKPLYHDNIHLSTFGSELLVRIFDPIWARHL
ncbi:MAG: acyltransferase, partial [Bdellovibrionales bacterium]|nr:acyltransferase [Bdellovibrionales bacterium]